MRFNVLDFVIEFFNAVSGNPHQTDHP
jgi:hypothetical protein